MKKTICPRIVRQIIIPRLFQKINRFFEKTAYFSGKINVLRLRRVDKSPKSCYNQTNEYEKL